MHTRVRFILDRLNADFAAADLGPVGFVEAPGPGWPGPVFEFAGHQTFGILDRVEECTALLANQFQDDVMGNQRHTWPEVEGRPLFASSASGVACWCLDDTPWCAIGQLAQALAAYEPV